MVALVRPLIADPECVNKYRCGREAVVDELKDIIPDTRIIGDCSNVGGTLWQSVRSGFEMAFEI